MTRALLVLTLTALLGACSSLPADGPSTRALGDAAASGYALIDLDAGVAERLRTAPIDPATSLAGAENDAPIDVIGVGDTLTIAIYEPSGALFGSRGTDGRVQGGGQTLPNAVVDRSGAVGVPFAGAVRVSGLTAPQASEAIRRALSGRVGSPQVTVSIAASPSNSVVVLGEVRNPGRAPLTPSPPPAGRPARSRMSRSRSSVRAAPSPPPCPPSPPSSARTCASPPGIRSIWSTGRAATPLSAPWAPRPRPTWAQGP
jgi:polysaccharide export outer membrane protein